MRENLERLDSTDFGNYALTLAEQLGCTQLALDHQQRVIARAIMLERKRRRADAIDRRLFERGAFIEWQCAAVDWKTDKDRPVFCQCNERTLEGEDFCGHHVHYGKRKYGAWRPCQDAVDGDATCDLLEIHRGQAVECDDKELRRILADALDEACTRADNGADVTICERIPVAMLRAVRGVLAENEAAENNDSIFFERVSKTPNMDGLDVARHRERIVAVRDHVSPSLKLERFTLAADL